MNAHFLIAMANCKLQNYIRTYRKRSGLSQDELTYLLGRKSGSVISRCERLRRMPSLEMALRLEVIFRLPVKDLFAGMFTQVERQTLRRVGLLARRLMETKEESLTAHKLDALAISVRGTREPRKQL